MQYDVAIIGTGPAGLSAALNLKLHNKSIIWFGSPELSVKVEKSEKIANYPGVPFVKGEALNELFKQQIEATELSVTDRMVTTVSPMGDSFMLLGDNDVFEAKTVLLATGAMSAKAMPGENELLGMGVSYCATCDGFLYKGKTIAVYVASKRYEHEVKYLAELAETVYVFAPYENSEVDLPNVIKITSPIVKVLGEDKISGIEMKDGSVQAVDGFFILRTAVAPSNLVAGLELAGPDIVVNRKMETSIPGIYAAGDCTGRPYQITKATGEGNVAAHSIIEYLAAKDQA